MPSTSTLHDHYVKSKDKHYAASSILLHQQPLQMVSNESVRASNAQGHRIKDFVAIFVGGTGGIGEATVKELFKRTVRPKAYIIGR
jgi:hypothetical protein